MTHRNSFLRSALVLPTVFSFLIGLIPMTTAQAQVRRERPAAQTGKGVDASAQSGTFVAERAVDSLKQDGSYNSLVDAVKRVSGPKNGSNTSDLFNGGQYEEKTLTSSDGNTDQILGVSVAISGNTAVVGSDLYGKSLERSGAYVFTRTGNTWTEQTRLTPSDGSFNDRFGYAVAISGDTIAVGAPYADSDTDWNDGAVYIYERSGNTWNEQTKLLAADKAPYDFFGSSLAFSGDTLVIGAPFKDEPLPECTVTTGATCFGEPPYDFGAAYVFVRSGSVWSQQQRLLAPDALPFENFGFGVAVDGDTIAVGAPGDNAGALTDRGTVFVFTRSGTTWTIEQTIAGSDSIQYDNFGHSVALEGNWLVVGSPYSDSETTGDSGAAYLFSRTGTSWTQTQKVTAATPQSSANFGLDVAIQSNTVLIGHPGDSLGGSAYGRGSVDTFNRSGSTWTRQYRLLAEDGQAFDSFGYSVAIDGDTVIVGVPFDQQLMPPAGVPPTGQGSARIFQTKVDVDKQSPSDGNTSDWFGRSVAISGDTAVVGAPLDDIGAQVNQGSAYVFIRAGSSWIQEAKLTSPDAAAGDNFGWSVSIDGERIIIGAPLDDNGASADEGSAYVFVKSGGVWTQQQKLLSYGGSAGNNFGWSVAISGGRAIIGEPLYDNLPDTDRGRVVEYLQSGTTWNPYWLVTYSAGSNIRMGWSVSLSGDTAAIGFPGEFSEQGVAWIFQYSPTAVNYAQLFQGEGAAGDNYGWSVSISGDTVVVGAPQNDTAGIPCPVYALGCSTESVAPEVVTPTNQGAAYVFTGSGTSWTQQQKVTAGDGGNNDQFGYSVSNWGNNLFVGAYGDDVFGNADQGAAYLYKRVGTDWLQQRKFTDQTGGAGDGFGWAVAVASSTAVVGAWADDIDVALGPNQGSASFYNWTSLAPTAAGAKLAGTVLSADGRVIRNATVVLTDAGGTERTVQTGTFGNFSFENLPSGETYIIGVRSGRHVFAPQAISLQDDMDGLTLRASGGKR